MTYSTIVIGENRVPSAYSVLYRYVDLTYLPVFHIRRTWRIRHRRSDWRDQPNKGRNMRTVNGETIVASTIRAGGATRVPL